MLSPSEYDRLTDQISALYARLDQSIIEDMARRIARTGYISEATRDQAERLQQAGLLYEDIIAEIARTNDASAAMVRALFEDAGVQSIRNDNRFYRAAGLEGIVKMSDAALQTLNAGYVKCQGELQNLTLTTAITAQQAYLQACDLAYMQVSTGTMDYQTAIRRAVQAAADEGAEVLYPSGHKDKLDVAIRRSVLTGFGQTARQLGVINANDMGCDLMEITAHAGARPSHAEWQGQIVSLSGRKGYLSKSDIGYGTGDGFGGWNCRHDWFPFFEGISQRAYTQERLDELNAKNVEIGGKLYTDYEASQMQRALEREIRKQKRDVAGFRAAAEAADTEELAKAMEESFAAASVKLKEAERELQDFLKQTGFLPDSSRVWVNGFGKSVSQKVVWANKKLLQLGNGNAIIGLKVMRFQDDLRTGKVDLSLRTQKQCEHILGDAKWKKRVVDALKNGKTPANMFFTDVDLNDLIKRYAGTGTIIYRDEKQNYPIEYVTVDHEIGRRWNSGLGRYVKTKRFAIVYSGRGIHLYPVKER